MRCEKCKKNESSVHLTEIIRGVKSEVHLCEQCAKEIGLNSKLSNFSLAVPDFITFLNDDLTSNYQDNSNQPMCRNCGTTLSELKNSRKVGCSSCYSYFRDQLSSALYFADTSHIGKKPSNKIDIDTLNLPESPEFSEEVTLLRIQLSKAVDNEEYEQAALLRDKIKELEQICQE
jgi:protein arginine kinase activator